MKREPVKVKIVLSEQKTGWYFDLGTFPAHPSEANHFHAWPVRPCATRPASLRAARRAIKEFNERGLVEKET